MFNLLKYICKTTKLITNIHSVYISRLQLVIFCTLNHIINKQMQPRGNPPVWLDDHMTTLFMQQVSTKGSNTS